MLILVALYIINLRYTVGPRGIKQNLKNQGRDLRRVNGYVSRIPIIYCMKSQQLGHTRAVLGSTAESTCCGLNRPSCLARPSYALIARIFEKYIWNT